MPDPSAAELGPYAAGLVGLVSSIAAALRFSGRVAELEAKVKANSEALDKQHVDMEKLRGEVAGVSNLGPASVSGASLRALVVEIVTAQIAPIRAEVSGALTSFRSEIERIRAEHDRDRTEGNAQWREFYRLVGSFQRALKDKDKDGD